MDSVFDNPVVRKCEANLHAIFVREVERFDRMVSISQEADVPLSRAYKECGGSFVTGGVNGLRKQVEIWRNAEWYEAARQRVVDSAPAPVKQMDLFAEATT